MSLATPKWMFTDHVTSKCQHSARFQSLTRTSDCLVAEWPQLESEENEKVEWKGRRGKKRGARILPIAELESAEAGAEEGIWRDRKLKSK